MMWFDLFIDAGTSNSLLIIQNKYGVNDTSSYRVQAKDKLWV